MPLRFGCKTCAWGLVGKGGFTKNTVCRHAWLGKGLVGGWLVSIAMVSAFKIALKDKRKKHTRQE